MATISEFLWKEIQQRHMTMRVFLLLAQISAVLMFIYAVMSGATTSTEDFLHFGLVAIAYSLFSISAVVFENQFDLLAFLVIVGYMLVKLTLIVVENRAEAGSSLNKENLTAYAGLGFAALCALLFFVLVAVVFRQMGRHSTRTFYAVGSNMQLRLAYRNWLQLNTVLKIDCVWSAQVLITAAYEIWTPLATKIGCGVYVVVMVWYYLAFRIVKTEWKWMLVLWYFAALAQPAYAVVVIIGLAPGGMEHSTALLQAGTFLLIRVVAVICMIRCTFAWGTGFTERAFAPGKPDGPRAEDQEPAIEWDSVLAFSTVRIVRIHDRLLGLMHHLLTLGIVGYIIAYTIVWEKGFQATAPPVGTVRLQLLAPAKSMLAPVGQLSYCGPECHACLYVGEDGYLFPMLPCQWPDQAFVGFPLVDEEVMLMTTRWNHTQQTASAGCPTSPTCKYSGPVQTSYVAEIEKFTLFIDHTMTVPKFGFTKNAYEMHGSLVGKDGEDIDPCHIYTSSNLTCPGVIAVGKENQADIVPISALLDAAGINLDTLSGAHSATGELQQTSRRYDGVVLVLSIDYSNRDTYNSNDFRYTYSVTEIPKAEFKSVEQLVSIPSTTTRYLENRHGVALVVQQTGLLGQFDFTILLLRMVAGLGLLAASSTLVDVVALMFLPKRLIYKTFKVSEVGSNKDTGDASRRAAAARGHIQDVNAARSYRRGSKSTRSSRSDKHTTVSDHDGLRLSHCDETDDEDEGPLVSSSIEGSERRAVRLTATTPMACAVCGEEVPQGSKALWQQGRGILHEYCLQ